MRYLLAILIFSSTGCALGNTISGRWVGCDPSDEVYVGLSTGTEGADEADYFSCERGGFEMSIPGPAFEFELRVIPTTGSVRTITMDLDGITGDYDVGVIQL